MSSLQDPPSNPNDSIVTDESCPDIESDSETTISYNGSLPRLMKIRNPSQRGRRPEVEEKNLAKSISPLNIKMMKSQTGTFNYVQTMKSS